MTASTPTDFRKTVKTNAGVRADVESHLAAQNNPYLSQIMGYTKNKSAS